MPQPGWRSPGDVVENWNLVGRGPVNGDFQKPQKRRSGPLKRSLSRYGTYGSSKRSTIDTFAMKKRIVVDGIMYASRLRPFASSIAETT